MKIYTRTGMKSHWFKNYQTINANQKYESGSVFWYDCHDAVINNLKFDNAFPNNAWKHIRKDSTSKILLFYGDEYYNSDNVEIFAKTIKNKKIPPSQIYIVCPNKNWEMWTHRQFSKFGVIGINIQSLNFLMITSNIQPKASIKKRFSIFSRNYKKWRLHFYCELINRDLLSQFDYTFNNVSPYGNVTEYSQKEVKQDACDLGYSNNEKIDKWIEKMPYTIKNEKITEILPQKVYDKISSSGINVIIETQFDLFKGGLSEKLNIKEISPSFPTEKTYKAVACNRPFIVISTPEFLKDFKQLGYKTFHPYINETYDTLENNSDRINAIVSEIERLSNLSKEEFSQVLKECKKITKHNEQVFASAQKNFVLRPRFKWMEKILNNEWENLLMQKGLL